MSRRVLPAILALVAASAVAAVGAHGAPSANPTCGSYTVGPGAHRAGSTKNAQCLLNRFKSCHAATYRLSTAAGNTIAIDDFSVANADGHCFVSVQTSSPVSSQAAKPGATALCASLKAKGTDVVALDCTGGNLPKTISLTGRK